MSCIIFYFIVNTAIFVKKEIYLFFFYLFAIGPNDVMRKIMQ